MIPVGQQIARALTEQFYRWELRGRGWLMWPGPVQLEPPFRPFEGHFLSQASVIDDGQIESFGSRFAKGLTGFLGIAAPPVLPVETEEIEEPDAEGSADREDLVELQIALPPDYQPHASVFEQFLFSIGYASEPVAFEVVGSAKELVVQVTTGQSDAVAVRQQLKAFFPEAIITLGNRHLWRTFPRDAGDLRVLDFGLEREFMVPLQNLKALAADPLVAICGALDQLREGEAGAFQVLLEPVRNPWAPSMVRAVSLGDGRPFFANDPELVPHTRLKVSRPLFAVVLRVAAHAPSTERVSELVRSLAGALRPLGNIQGNQLVPLTDENYDPEDHLLDVLFRGTHRSGMLLNSDEVVALAHLPTAAVRAKSLRRALQRTRPVPDRLTAKGSGVWIGDNLHEGVVSGVHLTTEARLNHCHILGGTGSGKSTLLGLMAYQDIIQGRGVAVIDPHGDLIDALLPHVPAERLDDVILFDPSDEDYAIAFNPLAAGSSREKELLAADFIAVMRQHTSSWGDQMSSLLGNAVLAFLQNTRTGTLPELRRFLVNPEFRSLVLKTVTSPEVAYFWEQEAALASKSAIGSILVRLDELLRSESLLHILGQRANKLDFGDIMDSGKIFLARLSKGLVGQANAYLLGGLLVSKFYQTTIARQSRQRENRKPYMLLMDEAGELLTSTISEILVGARKYGLGLTLAHQSLRQLTGNDEVYGAVTGSCGTKICFQVGGDDARKMADEFGGFVAADLMNLPTLHALARVGPRDASFNLKTEFMPPPKRPAAEAYTDLRERTRNRYGTPKAEIRKELEVLREFLPKRKAVDPFSELAAKQKKERGDRNPRIADAEGRPLAEEPPTTEASGDPIATSKPPRSDIVGGVPPNPPVAPEGTPVPHGDAGTDSAPADPANAEAIKTSIIKAVGGWGYSYETEKPILGNSRRVDIVLTRGDLVVACEISVTTTAQQEVANVLKCLTAGFQRIFHVSTAKVRQRRIAAEVAAQCSTAELERVEFLTPAGAIGRLGELAAAISPQKALPPGGKTLPGAFEAVSDESRKSAQDSAWAVLRSRMAHDRKNRGAPE